MPKVLTILGFAASGITAALFLADLVVGFPFHKASVAMDICTLIAAGILGFMSFATWRELAR